MGDGADYNDIERFLTSRSGQEHLKNIRHTLRNKAITDVRFENNTQNIKTLLIMDDGSRFYSVQPCHDVAVIRELFGDEIDRERAGSLSGER